ncbi:haloalkane dehalogenase [Qipengyuania sediminis]|uniref:haloalkane dehalogenase n=1 Tax=Qipengyuania sediminis TaxID=1532023 RepID=UPI001F0E7039|nr:haloalkane dehalogenase [Qipengyuania sediminis]
MRTPDSCFENLPGYSFAPHYLDDLPGYEGLRVHYLDEAGAAGGSEAGRTFLCLHGQPSWSYLYRKMIPIFAAAGGRVVAPDLLGFGKSDKPVDEDVYGFGFHRNLLMRFIERLDLTDVTLVCQDWGGILGLSMVPEMAERFDRLIVMNTAIPAGESAGPGFEAWKAFNRSQPDLDIAALFQRSDPSISDAEAAAYAAPYPDARYKAGVRRFPELVPVSPEMEGAAEGRRARRFWSREWAGESFMAIGLQDPVLGPPAMRALQRMIRDCPEPLEIAEGGHFVQEHGETIARTALAHFVRTR